MKNHTPPNFYKIIEQLNELNLGSLSITNYSSGWEIRAYADNAPLGDEIVRNYDLVQAILDASDLTIKKMKTKGKTL